jgi:hypothetical protein
MSSATRSVMAQAAQGQRPSRVRSLTVATISGVAAAVLVYKLLRQLPPASG